jgi:hypothetical protein
MDVLTVDGRLPRTILSAMISDTTVLSEVAGYWTDGLFQHAYQNTVAQWCVDYFTQHSAAPGHHIQTIFDAWAVENEKADEVQFIANMLAYFSSQYQPIQSQFAIETASTFFNRNLAAARLADAQLMLTNGRVEDAWTIIEDLKPISSGSTAYTNLGDRGGFLDAYDYALSPDLISWPEKLDGLNEFFAGQLGRGCFVSFMAPEKKGKSWWLGEMAWQGARCGHRVAMFSVGDMSAVQIRRRLIPRIMGRPITPKTIKVPNYLSPNGVIDEDSVTFNAHDYPDNLPKAAFEATLDQWLQSPQGHSIKLYDVPMATMTAEGIRTRLLRLAHSGWPVDVVVIDYADILAAMNGNDDSRAQTNRTWQELRRISQELNCLVITATQADAASYSVQTLTRTNFSEDKRKLAHVTGMVGINQTTIEKDLGVTRLDWVLGRELDITKPLHVAGCLSIGRIAMLATF